MTQSRHPALVPLAKSPKACIACAACTLLCMHKYHSRNLARRLESKQARNFGMLDYPSAWGPQSREGENLAFSPLRPILFPNPSYALRISGLLWTVNKEHLKVLQHGKSCKPPPPPNFCSDKLTWESVEPYATQFSTASDASAKE